MCIANICIFTLMIKQKNKIDCTTIMLLKSAQLLNENNEQYIIFLIAFIAH